MKTVTERKHFRSCGIYTILEKFDAQNQDYRNNVTQPGTPIVIVEAAIEQCWGRYLGTNGKFVGMNTFGASVPSSDLFDHFGIIAEKAKAAAKEVITCI
ncbi:uncharacterized protein METZ01_LOCUS90240 [marine metagenome]|uniref:Transketolase-like C-terminal domain-containing protein n=1 Tax=marine metagenome TaxID=408172 RepID=A0A381VAH7_9ZZZZ